MKILEDPEGITQFTGRKPFTKKDDEIFQKDIAEQKRLKLNGHHLNGKKAHKAKKRKAIHAH